MRPGTWTADLFGVDWSAKAFSHCVIEILEGEMLSARLFEVVKNHQGSSVGGDALLMAISLL